MAGKLSLGNFGLFNSIDPERTLYASAYERLGWLLTDLSTSILLGPGFCRGRPLGNKQDEYHSAINWTVPLPERLNPGANGAPH
jgi:hypothetical protein